MAERKSLELKIDEGSQYLQALNSIATVVSQSLSLDTVLYSALDKTLEIMNKDIGGILLLDEPKRELKYAAYRGLSSEYVQQMHILVGEGIAGKVVQTGEAIFSENILVDPRAVLPQLLLAEGLRAFASVPLISKNKVLGVINIACLEPYSFSDQDIQLLNSIAAQVAMAVENAKLHQEVRLQDLSRGELLQEIFSIQEEERKRIARELHDDTSQAIVSLTTSLEAVVTLLPDDINEATNMLKKAQSQLTTILDGIHRVMYELRPSMLDDLGLVAAIRWLSENSAKKANIQIKFKKTGREKRLPSQIANTVFRVVQEALTNMLKHAQCKNAVVSLIYKPTSIEACVVDDGKGFDVDEAISSKQRPRGLGLIGMRERVELMKGTLNIDSHPDRGGTNISIKIPTIRGEHA